MSDLIQWPFVRIQYAGINNPRFVGDVVASNQAVLTGLAALAGLGPTDFAIFSGFAYTVGQGGNTYGPGIFYLNGTFYFMPTTFAEGGLYLTPQIQNVLPEAFQDTVTRFIYQVQNAVTTTTPTGNTPVFAGNMNQYSMDNKTISSIINTLTAATTLLNDQEPGGLPANYTVTFQQDKAVFFGTSTSSSTITFDVTGAVPGTVVRLKWTWGAALGLTIATPPGYSVIKDNGDLTQAPNNTNILYCLYCGLNAAGLPEISYSFIQAS
jgi:hypothetical protein